MSLDPTTDSSKPIVITGFGSIDGPGGDPNLSETLVQMLYHDPPDGKFVYRDINNEELEIPILTGPAGPQTDPTGIPCSYDCVRGDPFDTWLKSTDARIYVHLGIADDNYPIISFEKVAYNLPFTVDCQQTAWVSDYEEHNNYNKECIPDGDYYLITSFNIPVLIEKVIEATRGKVPSTVRFQESYNAGDFLCNFLYYRSLHYAKCKGNANVIFIHVPEELPQEVGMLIIKQVVSCMLDMQSDCDFKDEDVSKFVCPEPAHFDEDSNQRNSDHNVNQRDITSDTEEPHNVKESRKWHCRKLTRKQARNAHRRRKQKWKSRQRKH